MNIKFWLNESNEIIRDQLNMIAQGMGIIKVHGKCPFLYKANKSLSIKFSYGKKQITFFPGLPLSQPGIIQARLIAIEIGQKLLLNDFSLSWLESKKVKKQVIEREKNILESWFAFKSYFHELKKNNKLSQTRLWQNRQGNQLDKLFHHREKYFKGKYKLDRDDCQYFLNNKILNKKLLPDDTTRSNLLKKGILKNFLEYIDQPINILPAVSSNRRISNHYESSYCTDQEILEAIATLQNKIDTGNKRFKPNNQGWLCFLSVLACYGLRPHEFWNIKNWESPVKLFQGDYIPDPTGNIKAIIDPNNTLKVLAIGGNTKTGSRLVLPVPPQGLDFNQLTTNPLCFPLLTNPLSEHSNGGYNCSDLASKFFLRNLSFNPYQLRHAYAHRCDRLSIRPNLASKSMGHSLNVHNRNYLSTFNQDQLLTDYEQELSKLDPLSELKKRLSASFTDSQVKLICDIVESVLMS